MGERYSYQSRIQEFPGTNVNTFGIHFQDVGFKLKHIRGGVGGGGGGGSGYR